LEALEAAIAEARDAVAAARQHTDAAVAAAERSAVTAARQHTEAAVAAAERSAVAAARQHTDAAIAAAERSAVAAARQHTEAAVAAAERSAVAAAERSAVTAARQHTEAAVAAVVDTGRIHAEQLVAGHQTEIDTRLAELRRRIDTLRRSRPTEAGPAPTISSAPPPVIDPDLYVALEDRFRGDPATILERQSVYLPYLRGPVDAEHPVLDLGSGRGEWLRILADAGLPAVGVDNNVAFVAECREAGLEVVDGDLVRHLEQRAPGSLGAVTLFQVVEHLPFPVLFDVLRSAVRALRPGGVLIAETPNGLNLRVAASTFWIDPTHQRPLHPEVLVFLALEAGFASVERLFLNPVGPPPPPLDGLPEPAADAIGRLLYDVDGPGDFTLVART
jgi:SAM-dependent methyltransferase